MPAQVMNIGHRGAAGLAPENTLASFECALDLAVDAIELDVQLSADGMLVVYHNLTLNPDITRTAGGDWVSRWHSPAIRDLPFAALKSYDVGRLKPMSLYARRYPDQKAFDGQRIPLMAEVLDLVTHKSAGATEVWIEIKTSPEVSAASSSPQRVAEAIVKLISDRAETCPIKILSFDWRALAHVQKIAPHVSTVYNTVSGASGANIPPKGKGPSLWTAGINIDDFGGSIPRAIAAAGGRFWGPRHNQIKPAAVREAHDLGIRVNPWTVDRQRDIQRCVHMGVDGIISNRPDRVKKIFTERV